MYHCLSLSGYSFALIAQERRRSSALRAKGEHDLVFVLHVHVRACTCVRLCDVCELDKTSSTEPSAHVRRSPASHTTSTPGNGSALTMVHPAAGLLPPRHSLMGPGRQLGGVEAG